MTTTAQMPKVGARVTVQTWGDGLRNGTVTYITDDIKNGEPGFAYDDAEGGQWWAYLDQLVATR